MGFLRVNMSGQITITNSSFLDFNSYSNIILIYNLGFIYFDMIMKGCTIRNLITRSRGGAFANTFNNNITITDCNFRNITLNVCW